MSKNKQGYKKVCLHCDELFLLSPEYEEFCSDECEDKYDQDNNSWRYSHYEEKDIEEWDVDDHLAAWYDDMMEK